MRRIDHRNDYAKLRRERFGIDPVPLPDPERPNPEEAFLGRLTCNVNIDCPNTSYCIQQPDGSLPGTCYVPKNRYLSVEANPDNLPLGTWAYRVSLLTAGGPGPLRRFVLRNGGTSADHV